MAEQPTQAMVEAGALASCRSGKFETGEGTCAPICMDQLGSARRNCRHCVEVHGPLVRAILKTALSAQGQGAGQLRADQCALLKQTRDYIETNCITTIEGTLRGDGDEIIRALDAWRAPAPPAGGGT